MVKLLVKIGDNMTVQAEGKTTKDIFKEISKIQETFEDTQCGLCTSHHLQYSVREVEGNEFYELRCKDCYAKLTFGQAKGIDKLYPRRYKTDDKGKALKDEKGKGVKLGKRGWVKWNPETQSEE